MADEALERTSTNTNSPRRLLMRGMPFVLAISIPLVPVACTSEVETTGPMESDVRGNPPAMSVLTTIACGDQLTVDVTVDNDLTCVGDALAVVADGITVNLNGHTVAGDGTGVGITMRGRSDVTIKGGTVRNFVTGIFVNTGTGVVIKENQFTQNREGVFFAGTTGSVVKANVAWQNLLRGIMIRPTGTGVLSTDNEIVDNALTDNPSGILLFGQPANTIKGNTISGSTVAGLDLTGGGASGNLFNGNLLIANAAGIKFGAGWTGNSFIGNLLSANTCGLQGTSTNNLFKDNVFSGNTSDICP